MSWNDAKYDAWRLASPYDNQNNPEIFESEFYKGYYSCFENVLNEFDGLLYDAKKDSSIYLNDTTSDFDSLGDYIEYLLDDVFYGKIHNDEYDAVKELEEKYIDEKEYAAECKYQQMKDDKLTGDC